MAYDFAVEGDIKACFDSVHHAVMMAAVRRRIFDRKVLNLIRAFLGARILKEDGRLEAPVTGTPQGGILSPLLANVYLSALDRPFEQAWKEQTRYPGHPTYLRRKGQATYKIIRYADDFVVMVRGTREQAEQIREMAATILRDELRMELSLEKTLITQVDEGFDFLGHHVRRVPWIGTRVGWTFPSKKSLEAVKRKVKSLTDRSTVNLSLKELLLRLNPVLRGWSHYFRYDASKRTLAYVDSFAWWRVFRWLRKKHPKLTWEQIRRRFRDATRPGCLCLKWKSLMANWNWSLLFLAEGILFTGLGIPLILQKIPPNPLYGFRVQKTMSDPRIWYEANRTMGIDLCIVGAVIAVGTFAAMKFCKTASPVKLSLLNLTIMGTSLMAALIHSFWALRRL